MSFHLWRWKKLSAEENLKILNHQRLLVVIPKTLHFYQNILILSRDPVLLNDQHAFTIAHPQGREAWGEGAGSGTWTWRGPPPACPCSSPGSPPRCTSPSRQNVWSCKKRAHWEWCFQQCCGSGIQDLVLFWPLDPGSGIQHTVKKVDEVVRHLHSVTQDQFSLV